MDITKLSLVELKAMYFDLSNDLQLVTNEIRTRTQPKKEEEKVEEGELVTE